MTPAEMCDSALDAIAIIERALSDVDVDAADWLINSYEDRNVWPLVVGLVIEAKTLLGLLDDPGGWVAHRRAFFLALQAQQEEELS